VILALGALLLLSARPVGAVGPSPTVTELSSSADPVDAGQAVSLTASVSGEGAGTPTGTVSFAELGQSPFGIAALAGGLASITVTLPAGVRQVVATYGGNGQFSGSSDSLTQRWGPPVPVQVAAAGSPNPAPSGFGVTLTATVSPVAGAGLATGHVTFSDGSTVLGVAHLGPPDLAGDGPGRTATLTVSGLAAGVHAITATYSGDGHLLVGTAAFSEVIGPPVTTSTTLSSSPSPSARGQALSVTIGVTAQGVSTFPGGVVTLLDGGTVLATAQVGSGSPALLTLTDLAPGVHELTAEYGGEPPNFAPSTSPTVTQTVLGGGSAATSISLAASGQPAFGQPLAVRATVWAGPQTAPTGTVTFTSFGSPLGSVPLGADGTASLTFSPAAGPLSLDAAYSGDATFAASTTPQPYGLLVLPMATSLTVVADPNPVAVTQPVVLTGHVTPAGASSPGPAGQVSFLDGAVPLGTANLDAAGTATLVVDYMAPGSHLVTAQYLGDGSYGASDSTPFTETVEQVPITG